METAESLFPGIQPEPVISRNHETHRLLCFYCVVRSPTPLAWENEHGIENQGPVATDTCLSAQPGSRTVAYLITQKADHIIFNDETILFTFLRPYWMK
jgi:hypothetical protein